MNWHRPFSPSERSFLLVGLLRLADAAAVAACAGLAFWLREGDIAEISNHYWLAVALGTVGVVNVLQMAGLYDFRGISRFQDQVGGTLLAWGAVMMALIVLAYLTKTSENFSRLWAATWFVTAAAALLINRIVAVGRIEKWREAGKLARHLAIVGTGPKAEQVRALVEASDSRDIVLIGAFTATQGTATQGGDAGGAGLDDLLAGIAADRVDEVVIALDGADAEGIGRVIRALGTVSVEVRFAPDTMGLALPVLGVSYLGAAPLLDVHRRPLSGWSRVVKRVEDLALGLLFLVLTAPLMAVIVLAVRLTSPGPVLFRQRRLGFNNNAFTLYKFRTMFEDASRHEAEAGAELAQARRADPRVTAVGAVLRRTSLDELPQLFNVIRGEMSLVGPRPHALAHNQDYARLVDGYLGRHRVKPGITGWAQVNGLRGETDTLEKMRARVEHDLYYIEHWSLWFDLKILVMTIVFGFFHRNAY